MLTVSGRPSLSSTSLRARITWSKLTTLTSWVPSIASIVADAGCMALTKEIYIYQVNGKSYISDTVFNDSEFDRFIKCMESKQDMIFYFSQLNGDDPFSYKNNTFTIYLSHGGLNMSVSFDMSQKSVRSRICEQLRGFHMRILDNKL